MRHWVWVALLCVGCASDTTKPVAPGGKLRVVATTGIVADTVARVLGDRGTVDALMGPGVDPHLYRAKAGDLQRLQSADLIIYNGLHLEGKMTDILEAQAKALAITRDLDPQRDLRPSPEGFEGAHDPHVWFDVELWAKCVDTVAEGLIKIDPANQAGHRARAQAYRDELLQLHAEVKRKASTVPAERRVLITAHDAFYYFGRAYGFEVHGLQGVSTESAPGTPGIRALTNLIGTRRVPAIFGETSVPDKGLQAVVDAVSKDHGFAVRFVPGQLYSDALGDRASPAGSYVGMVRHNIDVIVAALR